MKKQKIKKDIPVFQSEDEERKFWDTHSFLDFPEVFKPVRLDLSHLRPSTRSVTIRLPNMLMDDLRRLANKRDVPYQSLMKILLAQKLKEELRHERA